MINLPEKASSHVTLPKVDSHLHPLLYQTLDDDTNRQQLLKEMVKQRSLERVPLPQHPPLDFSSPYIQNFQTPNLLTRKRHHLRNELQQLAFPE